MTKTEIEEHKGTFWTIRDMDSMKVTEGTISYCGDTVALMRVKDAKMAFEVSFDEVFPSEADALFSHRDTLMGYKAEIQSKVNVIEDRLKELGQEARLLGGGH